MFLRARRKNPESHHPHAGKTQKIITPQAVYAAQRPVAKEKKEKRITGLPISSNRFEDGRKRDVAGFAMHPVVAGIGSFKHAPQGGHPVAVFVVAEYHIDFSRE